MTKPAPKPKTMKVYPTAAFALGDGEIAKPDPRCERDPVELDTATAESVIARKRAITEKEGLALKVALAKKADKKADPAAGGSGERTPPAE